MKRPFKDFMSESIMTNRWKILGASMMGGLFGAILATLLLFLAMAK